jgi:hypothetical protein
MRAGGISYVIGVYASAAQSRFYVASSAARVYISPETAERQRKGLARLIESMEHALA